MSFTENQSQKVSIKRRKGFGRNIYSQPYKTIPAFVVASLYDFGNTTVMENTLSNISPKDLREFSDMLGGSLIIEKSIFDERAYLMYLKKE